MRLLITSQPVLRTRTPSHSRAPTARLTLAASRPKSRLARVLRASEGAAGRGAESEEGLNPENQMKESGPISDDATDPPVVAPIPGLTAPREGAQGGGEARPQGESQAPEPQAWSTRGPQSQSQAEQSEQGPSAAREEAGSGSEAEYQESGPQARDAGFPLGPKNELTSSEPESQPSQQEQGSSPRRGTLATSETPGPESGSSDAGAASGAVFASGDPGLFDPSARPPSYYEESPSQEARSGWEGKSQDQELIFGGPQALMEESEQEQPDRDRAINESFTAMSTGGGITPEATGAEANVSDKESESESQPQSQTEAEPARGAQGAQFPERGAGSAESERKEESESGEGMMGQRRSEPSAAPFVSASSSEPVLQVESPEAAKDLSGKPEVGSGYGAEAAAEPESGSGSSRGPASTQEPTGKFMEAGTDLQLEGMNPSSSGSPPQDEITKEEQDEELPIAGSAIEGIDRTEGESGAESSQGEGSGGSQGHGPLSLHDLMTPDADQAVTPSEEAEPQVQGQGSQEERGPMAEPQAQGQEERGPMGFSEGGQEQSEQPPKPIEVGWAEAGAGLDQQEHRGPQTAELDQTQAQAQAQTESGAPEGPLARAAAAADLGASEQSSEARGQMMAEEEASRTEPAPESQTWQEEEGRGAAEATDQAPDMPMGFPRGPQGAEALEGAGTEAEEKQPAALHEVHESMQSSQASQGNQEGGAAVDVDADVQIKGRKDSDRGMGFEASKEEDRQGGQL